MKRVKSLILLGCILSCSNVVSAGVLNEVVKVDVGKSQTSLPLDQIGDSFPTIVSIPDLRLVNQNSVDVDVSISINSISFPAAYRPAPAVVPQDSGLVSYVQSVTIPANGTFRFNFLTSIFSMELLQNGHLCGASLSNLYQAFKEDLSPEEIPNDAGVASIESCASKNFSISVSWPDSIGNGGNSVEIIPILGLTNSSIAVVADYTPSEFQGQYLEHMASALTGRPNLFVFKLSSTEYKAMR